MARKFLYDIHDNGSKFNLYVSAKPAFSQREMYAKQHNILRRIDELPFNNIEFQVAGCREGDATIVVLPEPSTSAFHVDKVTLDKVDKTITIHYDNILEFVLSSKDNTLTFLDWLKRLWLGEWEEKKEAEYAEQFRHVSPARLNAFDESTWFKE